MKQCLTVFFTIIVLIGFYTVAQAGEPIAMTTQSEGDEDYLKYFSGGVIHVIPSSHQDIAWENNPDVCEVHRRQYVVYPALQIFEEFGNEYAFSMEAAYSLEEFLGNDYDFKPDEPIYLDSIKIGEALEPESIHEAYPKNWEKEDAQHAKEELKSRMLDKRFAWGALYSQPYESILSGEQLVRQVYYGRKFVKQTYPPSDVDSGGDARVATNVDVPATTLQMPQILLKSNVAGLLISRVAEGLWHWQSPDGSRIPVYSNGKYGSAWTGITGRNGPEFDVNNPTYFPLTVNSPENKRESSDQSTHLSTDDNLHQLILNMQAEARFWLKFWAKFDLAQDQDSYKHIPLYYSVDAARPLSFIDVINTWNGLDKVNGTWPKMQHSTQDEFFEAVGAATQLPLIKGKRPNPWLYIHGPGHPQALHYKRQAAVLLPAVEAFATVKAIIDGDFSDYPQDDLNRAWKASIYPDVGWGGKDGAVTDVIFEEKLKTAQDTARGLLLGGESVNSEPGILYDLAARIKNHRKKGTLITVFNALSWKRSGPVECYIDAEPDDVKIITKGGRPIRHQTVKETNDGNLIIFVAKDVPPLGFKTYYVVPGKPRTRRPCEVSYDLQHYQNRFYEIDFGSTGIEQIYDKNLLKHLLETAPVKGFDVVVMAGPDDLCIGAGEYAGDPFNGGDPWKLTRIAPQPAPDVWMHKFSDLAPKGPDALKIIEEGPVRTVYRVRGKITIEAGDCNCAPNTTGCERSESLQTIEKTIIVYHKIPLISWEIRLPDWPEEGVNFDESKVPFNVEFRAALPIAMTEGKISYEVPMGVLHVGEEGFEFSRQDGPDDKKTTNQPGGWTDQGVYTSKSGNYNAGDTQPRELQNFISANDENAGFGVTLSSGVAAVDWVDIFTHTDIDHWPYPWEPQSPPVLQPVLLATRHSCHSAPTSNWFGFKWKLDDNRRPISPPAVDQSDLSFRFSLKSHEAGWLNGFHFGHEANNPLLAVHVKNSNKYAPRPLKRSQMSFARVTEKGRECNHVVITALKRWQPTYPAESENEKIVILRLCEIAGQESTVRVFLPFRVTAAESVNMIEEDWDHPSNRDLPKQKIDVHAEGHFVKLTIGKHAVETIKLTMK